MILLAAEQASGGLTGALGLDLRSLILNGLAFLVLVWLFGRYLYPPLTKALDAKRDELAAAARAGEEARSALADADQAAAKLTAVARGRADDLLFDAQRQAEALLSQARNRATLEAEQIITEAKSQLARDVEDARRQLRAETATLVAKATQTVIGKKLDDRGDAELVRRSLEAS